VTLDFSKIEDFTETAKRASSLDEIATAFLLAAKDFGFDSFSMSNFSDFDTPPADGINIDRFPPEWVKQYYEGGYSAYDPTFKVALRNNLPFTWHSEALRSDLTDQQTGMYEEAELAGLKFGVSVPISLVGSPMAVVSVCGDNLDISPAGLHAAHLMAIYLHAAAVRISQRRDWSEPSATALSPREQECLRWVSAGKTNWEIGRILDISDNTVHYHLERAKRKLGATTRAQAAVRAILSSEIAP